MRTKTLRFLLALTGLSASLLLPALERRFGVQRHNMKLVETLIQQGGPEADNLLCLSGAGYIHGDKRGPAVKAAFVEQAAVRSDDPNSLQAAARTFYFRPLFLEQEDPRSVPAAQPGNWTLLSLQKDPDGATRVQLPVSHPEGWLYLSLPYSPGWSAKANGSSRRVLRAERAFLAVEVLAPDRDLRLTFRPWSYYFGFGISLLTLAFLIWPGAFRGLWSR